jgi:hypothetical protein
MVSQSVIQSVRCVYVCNVCMHVWRDREYVCDGQSDVCMYVWCEREYLCDGQSVKCVYECMYGVREIMCVMASQSVRCVYV